jgi:hypothetical protein
MNKEFFFDTADVSYIRAAWEKIKDKVDRKSVVGITTNPNAFFKVGKLRLSEWLDSIPELCDVVAEIRGDDEGIVYVQGPSSKMTPREIFLYSRMVKDRATTSFAKTRIGLKIPPYTEVLRNLGPIFDMHLNVTGVADASTALKSLSYGVRYVSIIPGRMEEAGIDANAHLSFVAERFPRQQKQEIISGSMRTVEGLISTFQRGTVPTIGERVWNILLEGDTFEKMWKAIENPLEESFQDFSPNVTEVNTKLSTDFFIQMDKCGEQAYIDLKDAISNLETCYPSLVKSIETHQTLAGQFFLQ